MWVLKEYFFTTSEVTWESTPYWLHMGFFYSSSFIYSSQLQRDWRPQRAALVGKYRHQDWSCMSQQEDSPNNCGAWITLVLTAKQTIGSLRNSTCTFTLGKPPLQLNFFFSGSQQTTSQVPWVPHWTQARVALPSPVPNTPAARHFPCCHSELSALQQGTAGMSIR